jgi:hypothetical protein
MHAEARLDDAHSTFSEDNSKTCQSHGREDAMKV